VTGVDQLVGRLVDGRYRIGALIARGGMATVYEGVDTRLDRPVAVKILDSALARDEDFERRFQSEARHVARLSHSGIVAVFDQGRDGDVLFLVMEYVHGQTLRHLLNHEGRLTVDRALRITGQVLAALTVAHAQGIVHRDIKPENVLLDEHDSVKVADFGLARAMADTTRTSRSGQVLGTVAYLSPEQVERGRVDERSDVYSTGIMLFELLTGSRPFTGDNALQVAYQHVNADVPPPSSLVPSIRAEVDELVAGATRRDRQARFGSARSFSEQLRRVRRGELGPDDEPTTANGPGGADDAATVAHPTFGVAAAGPATTGVLPTGELDLARASEMPTPPMGIPPPGSTAVTQMPTPRRRRRWPVVALVLLVLAGGGVGGWWWFAGRYTPAPALQSLTVAAAQAEAGKQGLRVHQAGQVFSETMPSGQIDHADPGTGERVAKGGTIEVFVSKGPERYSVPTLTGRPLASARSALTSGHLTVGAITKAYSESVPGGQVVSSAPSAGTALPPGRAVDLVVSKGREPIDVPRVVGKSVEDAKAAIAKAKLKAKVHEEFSNSVDKGDVIRQSPSKGTLFKGQSVSLAVSKGPDLVEVPRVRGQSLGSATAELENAGFRIATQRSSFYFGARLVIGQSPTNGQLALRGSVITLTIV
jgi:beta-lactam-binding protein with PASTA domain/tRNA A-37 threonylcarbamoyl transferase component Bud32